MHQSRHSWATIARGRERISDEVISAGLGHSSLQTTRIYLDSFELPVLREAGPQSQPVHTSGVSEKNKNKVEKSRNRKGKCLFL